VGIGEISEKREQYLCNSKLITIADSVSYSKIADQPTK